MVIGNPPYGRILGQEVEKIVSQHHEGFRATRDAFVAFIYRGIEILKEDGVLELIVPSAWHGGPSYETLRKDILTTTSLHHVIELPFDMFKSAFIDTAIFGLSKTMPCPEHEVTAYSFPKRQSFSHELFKGNSKIKQADWKTVDGNKLIMSLAKMAIEKRLSSLHQRFSDYVAAKRGVLFDKSLLKGNPSSSFPYLYFQGNIYRYTIEFGESAFIGLGAYIKEGPHSMEWYSGERILLRRLLNRQQRLMATISAETFISNKNLYIIKPSVNVSVKYLLALLNSSLLSFVYTSRISQATKDDFPQVTLKDLLAIPVPSATPAQQTEIVGLVDRVLTAKSADHAADTAALEAKIDALIYRLYGLTEEEIQEVERR